MDAFAFFRTLGNPLKTKIGYSTSPIESQYDTIVQMKVLFHAVIGLMHLIFS